MADEDSFPWELLKADCLRLVCQQLLSQSQIAYAFGKRDDMVVFLRDISTRGCECPRLFTLSVVVVSRKKAPHLQPTVWAGDDRFL